MSTIKKIIAILKQETKSYTPTLITQIIKEYGKDPFLILICCLLSLRSKDIVTIHVCRELLKIAKTPQEILDLPISKIERIIFKIGFYKNKAKVLHKVSRELLQKYNGKIPNNLEDLLNLSGVGQKTANLVLGLAFDFPSICVDIHVHRISNRLGLVSTKTPDETEIELKNIIPKENWIEFNDLLVKLGQNICTPISPWCSKCIIKQFCKRIGVEKSR